MRLSFFLLLPLLLPLPAAAQTPPDDARAAFAQGTALVQNSHWAEALAAFEARYRGDALVLDKWFQIQAGVPGERTVDKVRVLMRHPAFSIANPNRVRSLIGTFASANQTGFHRADGEGYRLFAETVLEVEKRNPQVAARLATALRSWRSLEPGRQAKAKQALLEMAQVENLSADLRDIVERTLA